ncbi:MAG: flagellar biosynthetic protein FliQ, partial [Nitriliruptoraceae bacterium]
VIDIITDAMPVGSRLAGPLLLTALVIGVGVSLLQTVTQIQEMTLSFVPKVLGLAAVFIVAGNWMLRQIVSFSEELWASIPNLVMGG